MKLSLKELAIPVIKSIDSFNYLLKSHHRRTAVIAYHLGKAMGLTNDELFLLIVAAALHDVGALSIQERDMLVHVDVENPLPHCVMGYQMLSSFDAFKDVAQIVRHHHIQYSDYVQTPENIPLQSHLVHFADRVDVLISQDEFILNQKARVTESLKSRVGTVFHPEVFAAFEKASKADIFWIEINNLEIEQLFKRINFSIDFELTIDNVVEFSLMLSRIIDFRSRFTASHSYTVGQLSYLLGHIFGCDELECKKLLISGYLHDIGKLGIDPSIIEKHGPLTEEEFNQMKLHSYYTGQILQELSHSEWFHDIIIWAERHHEKVSGNGYPYSLSGADLDMKCKIVAFADVISALMEERPYRQGMPIDDCFTLIQDKIATGISLEMFDEIKKYSHDIDAVVHQCHQQTEAVFSSVHR